MTENEISKIVLDAAIEVHRTLGGPGPVENVYEEALAHELGLRGLQVKRKHRVPIVYKGKQLGDPLSVDLLVEERVVIACKATTTHHPVFEAQTLTYLRLLDLRLGLLVNFGQRLAKDGFRRVVNGL